MKVLSCPSCGAPAVAKPGIGSHACAFCETEFKISFNDVPELDAVDNSQVSKLLRRADDARSRGYIKRCLDMYESIADYVKNDLNNKDYLRLVAVYYSLKSYYSLWDEYDIERGDTVASIKLERDYAETIETNISWNKIDYALTEDFHEVEDFSLTLDDETRSEFLSIYFKQFISDINSVVGPAYKYLIDELSTVERTSAEGLESLVPVQVDGAIQAATSLKLTSYEMIFKLATDLRIYKLSADQLYSIYTDYQEYIEKKVDAPSRFFKKLPSEWASKAFEKARSESQRLEPYISELIQNAEQDRIKKFIADPYSNISLDKSMWPSNSYLWIDSAQLKKRFNDFAKDFEAAGRFPEHLRQEAFSVIDLDKSARFYPKWILITLATLTILTGGFMLIPSIAYLWWAIKNRKKIQPTLKRIEQKCFDALS